jgi:hypothetical protein
MLSDFSALSNESTHFWDLARICLLLSSEGTAKVTKITVPFYRLRCEKRRQSYFAILDDFEGRYNKNWEIENFEAYKMSLT